MHDNLMREQAKAIASLLPTIMRQLFTGDDDPAGELPLAQLRVCSILQHGPRSMSALSRELSVSLSALTQIADRLERTEMVSRIAEESDRRVRCLQLTQRGAQFMQLQQDFRIERVLAALNRIPPARRMELHAALEVLLETCVQMRDQELTIG